MPVKMTLYAKVDGAVRMIDRVVDSVSDVDTALKRFSGHMRKKVEGAFQNEGPGWTPLAASTKERRDAKAKEGARQTLAIAQQRLASKLRREYKRAVRSGDSLRAAGRKRVFDELKKVTEGGTLSQPRKFTAQEKTVLKARNKLTKALSKARKAKNKGAAAHYADRIKDFDYVHKATLEGVAEVRSQKSIGKLHERLGRAVDQASEKILGKMASSIYSKISKGTLEIGSKISWAGVHNEGGSVGKGAKVPQRQFLKLDGSDLDVLVLIFEEAAKEAAKG